MRRGKVTIASGLAVGKLADKSFSDKLWMEYQRYIEMARCIAPAKYRTLRDVDKYLWGRDWYEGNQRSARLVSLSEMQDRLRGAETSGFSVVQGSEPVGGVQLIPWHKYGAVAEQLLRIFDEDWAPLISRRFDLDLWMYTPEGAYLMGGVWGSAGPNEQQIATAICCILRQQKFNDGALQGYFQSGLLYKMARRAGEIYDELQNPSGVGPQHAPVLD